MQRIEFDHMMDGSLAFSVEPVGGIAMFRDHRDNARNGRGKPVMGLNADGLRLLQQHLPDLIAAVEASD